MPSVHEIDLERAERDAREAEAILLEQSGKYRHSLRVSLRRSLVRIEVSLHLEEEKFTEDDEEDEES